MMLFGLGFISIGAQIFLLREFFIVFNGNELVFGIVFSLWLMFTGAGAYLARFIKDPGRNIVFAVFLLVLNGSLPSILIIGLDWLKVQMIPTGSMAGLWMVIVMATAVQLPFCLLNGFLFSFLSTISPGNALAGAYSWESAGSMASGALVNLVFLWIFDSYLSLLLLSAAYFIALLFFTYRMIRRNHFYLVTVCSLSLLGTLFYFDLPAFSERNLFNGQQVISNMGTPYGQVVVTKNQNQMNFYENGLLLFSSGNEISNEENVHPAMVQREMPRHVLLISGGYSGTLDEIMKYKPERVDYVEMNPSLIRIASKYTGQLRYPSVRVHEMDARKFIRSTTQMYDVILVNLPAPSTLQLNRYYTLDFLVEIDRILKPGGVLSYSLPTGSDYVGKEASQLNAVLYHTLNQIFDDVLVVPLERNYFMASGSPLNIDIPALIQERGIPTVYVNQYYLDAGQLRERSSYVTARIVNTLAESNHPIPPRSGRVLASPDHTSKRFINRDFYPVAIFYQNLWWLGYFSVNPLVILGIGSLILLLALATLNARSISLFTGGFTLASSEIILVFGLQVIYGFVFQVIGLIIMVFMGGLALGAGVKIKILQTRPSASLFFLQVGLANCSIVLPILLLWLGAREINAIIVQGILFAFAFFAAFVVGQEYRLVAALVKTSPWATVSRNYSADLFGSGIGAFFVTMILFPYLGILWTGVFLAFLNMLSAAIPFLLPRKSISL